MNDPQFLSLAWTQLVQVSVLIAVVWLLVKLFARQRPHLAHALWLLVLVKCLTPPVMSSPAGVLGRLAVPQPEWLTLKEQPVEEKTEIAAWEPVDLAPEPVPEPLPEFEVSDVNLEVDDLSRGIIIDEDGLPPEFFAETESEEELLSADEPPPAIESELPEDPVVASAPVSSRLWKLWFGSAGIVLLVTFARVLITLRRVYRNRVETPEQLTGLVTQLSKRLRLRRKVRILVTAARVGPAVVGWFRPLLILPEVIVFNQSNGTGGSLRSTPATQADSEIDVRELEPIIAHELLHVKRGDLGVGWLQVVVQSLWWFHPLVWLVNRFLSREAERCCDEAVVAELNCPPARYARCLLNVLEQKRNLTPIPACPGVKPVELTKQRMERIMKLGQGCRKRTPWWCWLILLLLGVLVLPGRGESEAEGNQSTVIFQLKEAAATTVTTEIEKEGIGAATKDSPELMTRTYSIDDVVQRMCDDHDLTEQAAQIHLEMLIGSSLPLLEDGPQFQGSPASLTKCIISENSLIVRGTQQGHELVTGLLKLWTDVGLYQVKIETRFASTDVQVSAENVTGKQDAKSALTTRLSELDVFRLINTMQSDARNSIFFAPKVTLFNGQQAVVCDEVERPFVTGMDGDQPVIDVLPEGWKLKIAPSVDADGNIELKYQLRLAEIVGVDTKDLPGQEPATVQIPDARQVHVRSQAKLRDGETLLISGLKRHSRKQGQADGENFLVMITPFLEKVDLHNLDWESTRFHRSQIQPVAGEFVDGVEEGSESSSLIYENGGFSAPTPAQPARPWVKHTWAWLKHTPPWKKYDREISVSFERTPLKQAIKQICAAGDLKVMFIEDDKDGIAQIIELGGYPQVFCDEIDLEEEAKALSAPVTFSAQNEAAIPILEEMLKPFGLGLGYVDPHGKSEGCFDIRSQDFLDRTRWTVVYPVGDLLENDIALQSGGAVGVPILDKIPYPEKLFKAKPKTKTDLAEVLIEILEKALTWDHSEANMATGTMKYRESSEALVISCSRAQHELISKLLSGRRKAYGIETKPVPSVDGPAYPRFSVIQSQARTFPNPVAADEIDSAPGVTGKVVLGEKNFDIPPEPISEKHVRPRNQHDRQITFRFEDVPLQEAIEKICELGDLQVDYDVAEFAEEGVSLTTPVSCSARNEAAVQALSEMLKPLKLTLVIEPEPVDQHGQQDVQITIRPQSIIDRRPITCAYSIGDLLEKDKSLQRVVGVPMLDKIPYQDRLFKAKPKTKAERADVLIEQLEKALAWNEAEGNETSGIMRFSEPTEALVIRCSRDQHELISKLLCERRKACGIEQEPATSDYEEDSVDVTSRHDSERVDPELWKILVQWERGSRQYKRLSGDLRVFCYFTDMELEQRLNGRFYYEAPDKWRVDLESIEIPPSMRSQRLNAQGKSFVLKSAPPEIRIRNGQQIAVTREDTGKVYSLFNVPETIREGSFVEGITRLGQFGLAGEFLCGLTAQEAVERYQITLQHDTDDVWLEVLPKRTSDKKQFQESHIILNRRTFLPIAIQLIGPEGNIELVHRFYDFKVDGNLDEGLFDIPGALKGFKHVQPDEAALKLLGATTNDVLGLTPPQSPKSIADQTANVQLRIEAPKQSHLTIHVPDRLQTRHQLVMPARKDLQSGQTYRLTLSNIPGKLVKSEWPVPYTHDPQFHWSLEIPERNEQSESYLAHNSIPLEFTKEDLDQVAANNIVTKVVYLEKRGPDSAPRINVRTLSSTQLDPGIDPIAEAKRRGTILAVLRSVRNREQAGADAISGDSKVVTKADSPARKALLGQPSDPSPFRKLLVTFDKTPLEEALKEISLKSGIKVTFDPEQLAVEGVTPQTLVSYSTEHKHADQVLRELLKPLGLVIEMTTKQEDGRTRYEAEVWSEEEFMQQHLVTIAYPVADLIVPMTGFESPIADHPDDALKSTSAVSLPRPLKSDETIHDVRIEGLKTIAPKSLLSRIGSQSGKPVSPDQIREDARALYNTHSFYSIEPRVEDSADGLVVVFRVHERTKEKNAENDRDSSPTPQEKPDAKRDPGKASPNPPTPYRTHEGIIRSPADERSEERNQSAADNLNSLAELIKKTVKTDREWNSEGAESMITFSEPKLMLVIRASQSTHDEIAELLEDLRRKQDLQVVIDCRVVELTDKAVDASRFGSMTLNTKGAQEFLKSIEDMEEARIIAAPKLTTLNGTGAQIQISRDETDERQAKNMHYMIVPTISEDRRTIDVKLAVNPKNTLDVLSKAKSKTIPDGGSVLWEVTDELLSELKGTGVPEVDKALLELKKKELGVRTFVLLTPRIVIQEEEEELLLGPPAAPQEKPLNKVEEEKKSNIQFTNPIIIIEEEDEKVLEFPKKND